MFFLPFFFAGLAIGLIFIKKVSDIGTYYFADLLGAGLGGLFVLFLFYRFTPQEVPSVIAFLPLIAAILVIPRRKWLPLAAFAGFGLIFTTYTVFRPFDLSWSQFKGIRYALNLPDAVVTHQDNSPYGYLQVVSSPVLRYAPGLSLNFRGTVPSGSFLYNNGDWMGALPTGKESDTGHLFDYTTMALPYVVSNPQKILLTRFQGGSGIAFSLHRNPSEVVVLEPDEAAVRMVKKVLEEQGNPLLDHPAVRIVRMEPRSYLAQSAGEFDLIVLPILGEFGGGVGLNALNEEFLLTMEAVDLAWNSLSPGGMLAVTTWMDHPYKIPLRTAATFMQFLDKKGISNPGKHLAAVRSWGTLTFIVKKSPLGPGETGRIFRFCDSLSFDPALLPGLLPEQRQRNNRMEDTLFFTSLDRLTGPGREAFYEEYSFRVRPVNDNSPYFYQFLRWDQVPEMIRSLGTQSIPYLDLGYLLVVVTFVQVLFLAGALILLPLFRMRRKGGKRWWILGYFAGLGIGYMLLEIVFIKLFSLYLGNPIYAAAVVISVMLVSSGTGSYFSSRQKAEPAILQRITAMIAMMVVGYVLFLSPLLSETIGWPVGAKGGMTLILVAVPAFFMGLPFPLGLKMADRFEKVHVPWAWGINGCFSVMTPPLAAILAVELGFQFVMILTAIMYGISFLSIFLMEHK